MAFRISDNVSPPGKFNVKTYGALGNGVHDDTSAIQEAIDAAWAVNGSVLIPSGTYIISALTLPQVTSTPNGTKSLKVEGEVWGWAVGAAGATAGTVLKCTQAGVDAISIVGGGHTAFCNPHYEFVNFSLMGPDTNSPRTTTSGNGIYLACGSAVPIVDVKNVEAYGFYGSGKCGFRIYGDCEDGVVDNLHCHNCDIGIMVGDTYNQNAWTNVKAQANATYGMHIAATSLSVHGGLVQSNERTGLFIGGGAGMVFNTIHFENNNSGNVAGEYAIKIVAPGSAQHVQFNACNFGAARDKVYAEGGAGYSVFGLVINGGTGQYVSSPVVTLGTYVWGTRIINFCSPSSVADSSGNQDTSIEFPLNMESGSGVGLSVIHGHAQMWDTAAPTAGTWKRGSVCFNTAPVPGGSLGWVCTTAGTPGTWKEFGSISL